MPLPPPPFRPPPLLSLLLALRPLHLLPPPRYLWITGRADDVINVSGHRIGTAEVESAILSNPDAAKCAVVGYPHEIKGTGIYAFVVLKDTGDIDRSAALPSPLRTHLVLSFVTPRAVRAAVAQYRSTVIHPPSSPPPHVHTPGTYNHVFVF